MAKTKEIVAANLRALMTHRQISEMELGARAGVSQSTINRLLKAQVAPNADTLDSVCRFLGIFTWQIMVPNINPSNLPVLREVNDKERAFYEKIKQAAKEISDLQ